jgi:hypothetical protein
LLDKLAPTAARLARLRAIKDGQVSAVRQEYVHNGTVTWVWIPVTPTPATANWLLEPQVRGLWAPGQRHLIHLTLEGHSVLKRYEEYPELLGTQEGNVT